MQDKADYLRKTGWCIVLVILIQVLKKYLDAKLPDSIMFHHYLLTGLQLLVLVWTIIILLFPSLSFIKKSLIIICMVSLPESLFTYWIHHALQLPSSLHFIFRTYAIQGETNSIQFNPESSVYDSSLFYTLKPSSRFVFANPEFADSFYTNKPGLRDDDSSLLRPDIICLGDSYAMGWGVKQNETFAELIGSRAHKKVLNAGISSYGTARELKNLYRLDSSNLQYILLQYCRNDFPENKSFMENNYSLAISSKEKYDSLVNQDQWSRRWFPGKRFISIARLYSEKKTNRFFFPQKKGLPDSALFYLQEAALYFTDIMLHSLINFNKVKVFVVDLNEKELVNNDFINEVNRLIHLPEYAAHFNNNLIMVPAAGLLKDEDYYVLDPHIRASGHRKVAERLYNYMFPKN